MNLEQIAYNIKFFREQYEWSQRELAEKLLTSRSVVAKWESNVVVPDISSLIKLSRIFDITLDLLIGTHSFRHELLKDFKRIYKSKTKSFDEEAVELVEYLMLHPDFKKQIFRLQNLPIRKQLSLHKLFSDLIEQYERL